MEVAPRVVVAAGVEDDGVELAVKVGSTRNNCFLKWSTAPTAFII